MSEQPTPEQMRERVKALVELHRILFDVIKERGERGIPNGHLYAAVMAHVDYVPYMGVIGNLKELGLITEVNHLLKVVPGGELKPTLDSKQ